jgi:hypothetical protein
MSSNFNLTAAVETWRNELAAQPQLTQDDRRELERHLTDSMADYRGRGLADDEAFWLARRRIGQPQQLADEYEYEKANPVNVWRQRIFWIALAIFVWRLFSNIVSVVTFAAVAAVPGHGYVEWANFAQMLVFGLVPVLFFVLAARGKLVPQLQKLPDLIRDRRRLALTIFSLTILMISIRTVAFWILDGGVSGRMSFSMQVWSGLDALNDILLGLAVIWVMPAEPKALRTA